jgi:hypothetical protein
MEAMNGLIALIPTHTWKGKGFGLQCRYEMPFVQVIGGQEYSAQVAKHQAQDLSDLIFVHYNYPESFRTFPTRIDAKNVSHFLHRKVSSSSSVVLLGEKTHSLLYSAVNAGGVNVITFLIASVHSRWHITTAIKQL